MSGKSLDAREFFFEYVDPENESQDLDEFLDSIDLPISVLEDDSNPKLQQDLKEKLARIRIKNFIDVPMSVPSNVIDDYNISKFDEDSLRKKAIAEQKIKEMPKSKIKN